MESPSNLMMITAVLGFAHMPDLDRLRERMRRRLRDIPRLRQRVESPARGRPRWVDVPVDLDMHIRHSRLDDDDETAIWDRVSSLMSSPLDRNRPLWTFDAIETPSGRCVLIARLHHSIGDGIALMLVLLSLTDSRPNASEHEDNPLAHLFAGDHGDLQAARSFAAELLPGGIDLMRRDSRPKRRVGPRLLTRTAKTAVDLLLLPSDPPSILRGPLQVTKRAACSRALPLPWIKSLASDLKCTINDLMTALVAGAVRRYLEREPGGIPSDIRAAVPINLRRLEKMGELGNRFGLLFVPLPVEVVGTIERVAEVRRRIDALKGSPEPIVTYGILHLIGAGPRVLENVVVDLFAKKATAVMSNVPGPIRTLYLAGEPIDSLVYWAPQTARVGLGISVSSYAGQMRIGIAADAGLVRDPSVLISCFHDELDALVTEVEHAARLEGT
jgi:diacylglycerol O-acyltransferase / wax synthase